MADEDIGDAISNLLGGDDEEKKEPSAPTNLIKDSVLGSTSRESQEGSFLAYMQSNGLVFDEYANEMKELDPGGSDGQSEAATNSLGIDIDKFQKKNPVQAEMDEQSKEMENITTDNIKKIRNPRKQAAQIDRTVARVGDSTCDEISAMVQALIKGEITPKQFSKALKNIGAGAMEDLLKDGFGAKDLKDLGKKAALAGAALLADRAGLDDQLLGLLNKLKSNKKKVRDISNTKKQKDKATKDIFKKLPPVLRNILKGDKNALQKFIDQHCNEARKNMTNDAMGRAGLSGKVKDFVTDK